MFKWINKHLKYFSVLISNIVNNKQKFFGACNNFYENKEVLRPKTWELQFIITEKAQLSYMLLRIRAKETEEGTRVKFYNPSRLVSMQQFALNYQCSKVIVSSEILPTYLSINSDYLSNYFSGNKNLRKGFKNKS